MHRLSLFSLILLFSLSACSQLPLSEANANVVPATNTPADVQVILAKEVRHATATSTSQPLAMAQATLTPTPTNTPRPTFTPTQPLTPIATSKVPAYLPSNIIGDNSIFSAKGVVSGIWVNLRRGPSTEFEIVGRVFQNDALTIVGRNEDSSWWQICCTEQNEVAWLTAQFVQPDSDAYQVNVTYRPADEVPLTQNQPNSSAASTERVPADDISESAEADTPIVPQGEVTGDVVNLRAGPSTQYEIVGRTVLSQTVQIVGRNDDATWWRVCCFPNEDDFAWIIGEYVDENFASDQALTLIPKAEIPTLASSEPVPSTTANTNTTQSSPTASQNPPLGSRSADIQNLPAPGNFAPPSDINPLTGLPIQGARLGQRPVIVCINNDAAARPQFGTSQADIMYEYLMEGYSITRFSGLFYGEAPEQIGPVRSARLVNVYMGALYDAPLLCSGASDQVRYILKNEAPFPYLDIDLDDPSNRLYSVSVGSDYRTRVRTSANGIRQWLSTWAEERPPSIRGFTFGSLAAGGVPAQTITVPYPSVTGSNVDYRYDPASGRYLRYLNGEPHTDGNTGVQINLDNVIVQYVAHGVTDIIEDSLGSTSIRLNLFGSNRAILFRDGLAFAGAWQSGPRGDMPHFFDHNGGEIPLKPGKTWISIVPDRYEIVFGN